jgi:hypothetical protein
LNQVSIFQKNDPTGDLAGLSLIMSHDQSPDPVFGQKFNNQAANSSSHGSIESREDFIHQDQARAEEKRSKKAHSLGLACAELRGSESTQRRDHQLRLKPILPSLGNGRRLEPQVLINCKMWKEPSAVEDESKTALARWNKGSGALQDSPSGANGSLALPEQPRNHVKKRSFANP